MKQQQDNGTKITALYERLSKDDNQKDISVSIAHQKKMLEDYYRQHIEQPDAEVKLRG